MYRRWKESGGKDDEYKTIIVRQVKTSQAEAVKDGVTSEFNSVYNYKFKTQNDWNLYILTEIKTSEIKTSEQ